MQIVSIWDYLDEMSNLFWEKNIINLLSAELAQRVVKVNDKEKIPWCKQNIM